MHLDQYTISILAEAILITTADIKLKKNNHFIFAGVVFFSKKICFWTRHIIPSLSEIKSIRMIVCNVDMTTENLL